MAKTTKTINVDADNWIRFQELVGNVSEAVDNYVASFLAANLQKTTEIDEKILDFEIKTLKNEVNIKTAELNSKINLRKQHQKMVEDHQMRQMQEEKERIEAARRCINCGNMIGEHNKTHKFPRGFVCHACFMGAGKEELDRWK